MTDNLLTVPEAAEKLRIAPWTMRHWLRKGKIHGVKIGRDWKIKESAIKRAIDGEVVTS